MSASKQSSTSTSSGGDAAQPTTFRTPAIVCCPVTTIVFGILHNAQSKTCALGETVMCEAYDRKHKPMPSRVCRVLKRMFEERPYIKIPINPALVAKFLLMPDSLIGKKLLRLLCDDSLDESIVFEMIAVAVGMIRAIQRNDMVHSTFSKSIALANAPTRTTDVLSYMSMSACSTPSELGSVEFHLPPNMIRVVEEVELRVHTVLSIVSSYRDSIAAACLSSIEAMDASISDATPCIDDEDGSQSLLRDTIVYIKSCIFDSTTKKRLDYIELVQSLSEQSKQALHCDTRGPSVDFLLTTRS